MAPDGTEIQADIYTYNSVSQRCFSTDMDVRLPELIMEMEHTAFLPEKSYI